MIRLLLAQRGPVPGLDHHPDPAHDDVASRRPARPGAADRPAGPRRAARRRPVSSALMFAVPSLNPSRLRGVAWAVDVDDVRPKPSCDQRTRAVPKAVRVRLRTACIATCGSSAQAWTTRSPSLRAGSSSSPGKWGSRDEAAAAAGRRGRTGRPAAPSGPTNSDRPKPIVIVRPAGGRSSASPVSSGGASCGPAGGPERSGGQPGREPRRHRRPPAEQVDQLGARRRREVERRRVHPVLRGRHDPGLVRAGERVRAAARGVPRRGRGRRRARQQRPDVDRADGREPAEPDRRGAAGRHAEERPARDAARPGARGSGVGHRVLGHGPLSRRP